MSYKTAIDYYKPPETIPVSNMLNEEKPPLTLTWKEKEYVNTTEPAVWGCAMWFSLHNGASRYPVKASNIVSQHMKGFILGLPYILPCDNCSEHLRAYIHQNYEKLDEICSGRMKLFEFFCKLHNYVNKRYGKPEMSVEDAYKMYTGKVKIRTLSY